MSMIYVICWGGTDTFRAQIIEPLKQKFRISKEEDKAFKYFGISLEQTERKINMDQISYAKSISEINIQDGRPSSDKERRSFQAIIGSVNWLSNQTRPDLAFDACELSTHSKHPLVEDAVRANKVIHKIKNSNVRMTLQLNPIVKEQLTLLVYADASFGNLPDGG